MIEDPRGLGGYSGVESRAHVDAVAADHYLHWLAMLGAAAYAWQLHGLPWAGAVLVGLLVVISLTNLAVLAFFQSLKLVRVNRWAWVVLAYCVLAWSGASVGRI